MTSPSSLSFLLLLSTLRLLLLLPPSSPSSPHLTSHHQHQHRHQAPKKPLSPQLIIAGDLAVSDSPSSLARLDLATNKWSQKYHPELYLYSASTHR